MLWSSGCGAISSHGRPSAMKRRRAITYRTRGHSHGPITRLVSPSDVGQLIKPFVFLDYFDIDPRRSPAIGFHPHSGIATVTVLLDGQISYEETSGTKGIIERRGVEWMRASGGVWHDGGAVGSAGAKGFQLGIARPPGREKFEAQPQSLAPEHFQLQAPARAIPGPNAQAGAKRPPPP